MLCFLSYAICLLYLRREDKIAAVVIFGFLLFLFSFVVWITKEIILRKRVLAFLSIAMHLDYTACKEMKMACIEPMNKDSISENAHLIHSSQESEEK